MSLFDSLPHEVDISRVSYAQDALGGDVPTEAAPYQDGISAWVQPASAASIKEFAARSQRVTHDVYFNEDPGLRLDDVITVASGPSYVGTVLAIRGFRECTAGLGIGYLAQCESDREQQ